MTESSPNEEKTLWEKEKLHVMSNFSFCNSVFKRLVLQTRKNQGLFGKGLKPGIYYGKGAKHCGGKKEIGSYQQPLFFNNVFSVFLSYGCLTLYQTTYFKTHQN